MPKLLRLTTHDINARFNTRFNSDIVLKPNSRVALQNLSMEVVRNEAVVDNTNDIILVSYDGGSIYHDIEVADATYNSSNHQDLLDSIALQLNKNFPKLTSATMGTKWTCFDDSEGKITIKWNRPNYNKSWEEQSISKSDNVSVTPTTTTERSGGTVGNYDAIYYSDKDILRGAGYFRIKLDRLATYVAANGENGVLLSLLTDKVDNYASITSADIKFGIHIYKDTSDSIAIQYIVNGVPTLIPNTGPTANPLYTNVDSKSFIEFKLYEKQIHFIVWGNSSGSPSSTDGAYDIEYILHSHDYDFETPLFPAVFFLGSNNNRIYTKNVRLAYEQSTNFSLSEDEEYDPILGVTNQDNKTTLTTAIQFPTDEIRDFLGFNKYTSIFIFTSSTSTSSIIADNKFQPTDISDSFIVMLDNIPLESFDAYDNSQKSMLAVIPKSDGVNGEVIYEPNYPTFININNDREMLIRNVTARILKNDLAEIVTNGLTTLTLIIEG